MIQMRVVKHEKCVYSELAQKGEKSMSKTLGEKIRRLRKQKGYTLEKLGELTDSSKSYIWELENKNPPRPSADKIAKIAATLGVTAEYLIDARESTSTPDAVDQAFFRKYRSMDPGTKEKIRQMVELWGSDRR
jgi:transcriptional regulator with XRE-family HTH domain